jgi:sensor histidine kinase YesM
LRNDGTIVTRDLSGDFSNLVLVDIIRTDKAERDRKPEKSWKPFFQFFWMFFISGFIIAFVSVIFIKIVKIKEYNKRRIVELELKAIRSQMNPHFVFNALGSIQSLINQEKTVEANQYLVNFAKLLRMALSTSEKKLTPLADELEQLDLYLRLEQLRIPFVYDITVDSNIHPADEEIPGMLIQPIVENAVIHGIVPKQGGHVSIRIRKEENILLVDVADDGAGFTEEVLQKSGFGIRAINERLVLLKDELKTSIGLKFENRKDKEELSGTRVTISIPT